MKLYYFIIYKLIQGESGVVGVWERYHDVERPKSLCFLPSSSNRKKRRSVQSASLLWAFFTLEMDSFSPLARQGGGNLEVVPRLVFCSLD